MNGDHHIRIVLTTWQQPQPQPQPHSGSHILRVIVTHIHFAFIRLEAAFTVAVADAVDVAAEVKLADNLPQNLPL